MVKARKARAVGFNHVALEVGDIEDALAFSGRLFDFKLRARAPLRPSSIWATNSSHCRRAVLNPLTRAAILDLWSTTRMKTAKHWRTLGSNPCPARFSTFSTHTKKGAPAEVSALSSPAKTVGI